MDDIDTIFEETQATPRKAHKRTLAIGKRIKVKSTTDIAKDNYKRVKRLNRANISKAHRDIASYKLLTKQAHNNYKLIKLENKR